MSAGVVRPDWSIQAAFNRDPNDPTTAPAWVDLTARARKASGLVRGRQYELDIPQAADPSVLFRDVEEYLNPANPSSPYAGRVLPYREILWQGVYPNDGTGNLINASTWRGNKIDVFDPSFESYITGNPAPNWMQAIGGMNPLVSTTIPFQGTKCIDWATIASNTQQGVAWPVACVPGRQYTSSAYVRQNTASTQVIAVEQTIAVDQFQYRTSSSTWTNAEAPGAPGPAWANVGGVNGDYTVASGSGLISISAVNSVRLVTLGANVLDGTVCGTIPAPSILPTGGPVVQGLLGRYADSSNHYRALAQFNVDQTITLLIVRRVAAANTTVTSVNLPLTYAVGDVFRVKFDFDGPTVFMSIWPTSQAPSDAYSTGHIVDSSPITAAGKVGFVAYLDSANTNTLPYVVRFDDFSATGWVTGTSTTTTGAYVRLAVTYTATQPDQNVKVVTQGAALAGIPRVDAIQHEHGGSASTFTTSGAVIYPVMRNYAERWPRRYGSAGFEGMAPVPCVDALAALNRIRINPEYAQAVLSLGPAYYWRLNDGVDTLQFADSSGNHQSPLVRVISKYGAATDPEPGTDMAIPGNAGGTGVTFIPPVALDATGTIIGCGAAGRAPGSVTVPPVAGAPWAATFTAWARLTSNTIPQSFVRVLGRLAAAALYSSPAASGPVTFGYSQGPGFSAPFITTTVSGDILDGKLHHVAGVVTQDATNTTVRAFLDGAPGSTVSVSTTTQFGGMITKSIDSAQVGGIFSDYTGSSGAMANGPISDVAIWNRALGPDEILDLYNAGISGFAGELSGTRITRHLGLGQYNGATRISAGSTTMQPPSWTGRIDLATDSLNTTVAEQGNLWPAPDGAVVFESRQDRWLRLTSRWTFGEDTGAGETPYLDDIEFDFDPTFVFPDVQVSRANGAVAIGGAAADVAKALRRYFPLTYSAVVDVQTDQQAQDLADWVFYSHRDPLQRVSVVVLDPASNPALWPVALGAEVGHRVTMKRRAKAANGGAGLTMSNDYFIEQIGHDGINFDAGTWRTALLLSPIGNGSAPSGPTFQPWILGDTTYGVLDTTTVLGW